MLRAKGRSQKKTHQEKRPNFFVSGSPPQKTAEKVSDGRQIFLGLSYPQLFVCFFMKLFSHRILTFFYPQNCHGSETWQYLKTIVFYPSITKAFSAKGTRKAERWSICVVYFQRRRWVGADPRRYSSEMLGGGHELGQRACCRCRW